MERPCRYRSKRYKVDSRKATRRRGHDEYGSGVPGLPHLARDGDVKQLVVPGTDLTLSRFVFGTSSLFSVGSAAKRRRLLEAALDHGFTHIDTAPYYGFGMAERDLRPVLAAHPAVTVTTKVGIYSPGGERQPALGILLRKAGGRALPALSRPAVDWSLARARTALEGSLQRLGRTSIDLYMLHEPQLALLQAEEWLRWLEREVAAGRVRRFGIAVEPQHLPAFLAAASPLAGIVQTLDSLAGQEADILPRHGRPLQITYGYISAALRAGGAVDIPALLTRALKRNAAGAVIVSTGRVERLAQYAALANA